MKQHFGSNRRTSEAHAWRGSRGLRLGFESLEDRRLLSVTPERLTALNILPEGSFPGPFIEVGSTVFFTAIESDGRGLWKTDLTETGTVRISDIASGGIGVNLNGTLFFSNLHNLWKSDGTAAGTVQVKDLSPGRFSSPAVNANGKLFFTVESPSGVSELWKSDGTEAGTELVKAFPTASRDSEVEHLVNVGGTLYFTADDGTHGRELWTSDGTPAGTTMLKDINPGPGGGVAEPVVDVNGTVFFKANDGVHGGELWKSDGTAAGTMLVKDIRAGSAAALGGGSRVNLGGTLFFAANDGTAGLELWKSDGTAAGTVLVKDINPGVDGGMQGHLMRAQAGAGALFFLANDGTVGGELWKTDGTEAGTVLVKDINPGPGTSVARPIANVDGTLFFSAADGTGGGSSSGATRLWKSDGTEPGTVLVADVVASTPVNVAGTLLFSGDDKVLGSELWKSDGTPSGTKMLKDIKPGFTPGEVRDGIHPTGFVNANGTAFFLAETTDTAQELWASDGTRLGTAMVKDINPGPRNTYPFEFTPVGDTLFFIARDGQHDYELWKSDGTAAGTVLVKDTNPTPPSVYGYPPPPIGDLENVGGTLFFRANDSTNGYELWKSDGTEAGTVMLKDLVPGPVGGHPRELTAVDEILYFTSGGILWQSDGTELGTVPVVGNLQASQLENVSGTLYFRGNDGSGAGNELWRLDGSGPALVKNIWPGAGSSYPGDLTNVGGTLFFRANDFVHGIELWKSDGTEAGTTLVQDLDVGTGGTKFAELTNVGGTLFFVAEPVANQQLWRTDGTAAGTVLLGDFGTAIENRPSELTAAGDALYFRADDAPGDGKLWRSDGTAAGTQVVSASLTDVQGLANVAGTLYFGATDDLSGSQAWVVRPASVTARQVFYNQSVFDLNSPGIDPADKFAIDSSKTGYLPGSGTITEASMTSYVHGINGIFVDVLNLTGTLSLDDFTFRVSEPGGANNTPSSWAAAPVPTAFAVLSDTPQVGTDRIEFIWANGAITNRYLEVTVEGNDPAGGFNANTGLAASDVFYFGNIVGDTFNDASPTTFLTTAADETAIQAQVVSSAAVASPHDLDRNGVHLASDRIVARSNTVFALAKIDISNSLAPAGSPPPASRSGESAVASALALPADSDRRADNAAVSLAWRRRETVAQVIVERPQLPAGPHALPQLAELTAAEVDELADPFAVDESLLDLLAGRRG